MKLFDKYLLACTNQRIPMPDSWQKSMGLDLTPVKQSYSLNSSEITGYKFQQDETLERGYVQREIKSLELDQESKYLIYLYLNALADHKGLNCLPYFSLGTTTYSFPLYTLTAPVIKGKKYSLYGSTIRPTTLRFYSTASPSVEIYSTTYDSLSLMAQKVIDTQELVDDFVNQNANKFIPGLQGVGDYKNTSDSYHKGLHFSWSTRRNCGLLFNLPVRARVVVKDAPFTPRGDIAGLYFYSPGRDKTFQSKVDYSTRRDTYTYEITLEAGDYRLMPGETTSNASMVIAEVQIYLLDSQDYFLFIFPGITEYDNGEVFSSYHCREGENEVEFLDYEDDTGKQDAVEQLYSEAVNCLYPDTSEDKDVSVGTNPDIYYSSLRSTYPPENTYIYNLESTLEAEDEYLVIEVVSYAPVVLLQGTYSRLPLTVPVSVPSDDEDNENTGTDSQAEDNVIIQVPALSAQVARSSSGLSACFPLLLPEIGYKQLEYSNKLIPTLLDINIAENSPTEEKELLSGYTGSTYQERILLNTEGLYDVDSNLGNHFVWSKE